MKEEQIKQKAEQYMRDFYNTELSETDLILFAEQLISETTKELQENIKDLEWQLQEVAKDNDVYQKQNKELQEQNTNLQVMLQTEREVSNEDYLKKVTELEAQIEKMKCCENCIHYGEYQIASTGYYFKCGENTKVCDKWELKE